MTRNEQRLNKAKKQYPIGTNFVSLFGATDVVTAVRTLYGKRGESHFVGDGDTILVFGKYVTRIIYSDGIWAKRFK